MCKDIFGMLNGEAGSAQSHKYVTSHAIKSRREGRSGQWMRH